jgi:hypothetical protein
VDSPCTCPLYYLESDEGTCSNCRKEWKRYKLLAILKKALRPVREAAS